LSRPKEEIMGLVQVGSFKRRKGVDLKKILDEHKKWLNGEGGSRADLSRANLIEANLIGADLRGADIDYSCVPLWCGGLKVHMDDRQIKQLMYHTLSIVAYSKNVSKELKDLLLTDQNLQVANEFHRVEECGLLTRGEENE
jgi:hypothetical protein